jgi:cytochrome c biogenesis protein CcdA
VLKNLVKVLSLCVFSVATVNATYVYEANQPLYDLQTNSAGSTGLGSNDDAVSAAFDLGFTFTFYGNDFTKARMATNGCLHFNLTGSYCGDYTPAGS